MCEGRILIVDDLPDVRQTLSGLLSDRGYRTMVASSRQEALQILEMERFHVAVVDVRLDNTDEDNQDGLLLMHEIKQKDPSVAVIILTGYANVKMVQEALQPDAEGKSLAYNFLEKSEFAQVTEKVKQAFDNALRINTALSIDDPDNSIQKAAKKIRFAHGMKPSLEQVTDEICEVLMKLFFECERIQVRLMERSFSGAAVFYVTPWYLGRGRGEDLVAKIGDHVLIERERKNYKDLVQGIIGGHRLPKTLEFTRTHSLSGIVYSFVGLGSARDFATFYQESDAEKIIPALDTLYLDTCFPWRRDIGKMIPKLNLREEYSHLLRLKPAVLQNSLDQLMGGKHPFHREPTDDQIWFGNSIRIADPVSFVITNNLQFECQVSIIHGDLNGYNVLVDRRNETWLIDFANTTNGPLFQDYASLEVFIRLILVHTDDSLLIYQWVRLSFFAPDIRAIELPHELTSNPELVKAHDAIKKVRQLAFSDYNAEQERAYLVGVLFNALKLLTVPGIERSQRDHALITAALITERLKRDYLGG